MQSVELESLLQSIQLIASQLSQIKTDISKQLSHVDYPDSSPTNFIERAIKLRQSFRTIAEGMQAKRALAQMQKQKIEKSKNYLQGLQFYKANLINKIQESQIDVVDLTQYYGAPLQIQNWIEDFTEIQQHLDQQLKSKLKKGLDYQELIKKKTAKEQQGLTKKDLYEKILPDKARRIYDQVVKTAQMLSIKELQCIQGITSTSLSIIYQKMNPLRINNTVSVTFSKQINEELEITILKTDHRLYKQANYNKVTINQPQTKIIISRLQPGDKLVIGLDRREDYTNEQVFQRLINDELVKPIYTNPRSQAERNFNAKYVKVDWLEDSLLSGILSPSELIKAIKERIFCLNLIGFISEHIKKLSFFFPLVTQEESQIPSNIKKTITGTLQKIKFQQFLEQAYVPNWVYKYRANYQELENITKNMSYQAQKAANIDKTNYIKALSILKLQEIDQQKINNYYKGVLNIYQNKLQFILIVPFSYPQKPSKIMMINWQKKKDDDRKGAGLENIPCKAKITVPEKLLCSKVIEIQRNVNEEIGQFVQNNENQPFLVLLQINRLITLLGLNGDKKI